MPGTPTKHEKGPIGTKGVDPYWNCTDPMRIWGPHKKIPESGFKNPDPEAFALSFGMIRGSGLSPDPESFCVLCFDVHLMDPDSRIRIRVRVTHTSFRKI